MFMNLLNHRLNVNSTAVWLNLLLDQPTIATMNKSSNIIKAQLKELGKTQGWLAEITGVSINAVSKWTRGGPIARENVMAVADALGITADQLLTGSEAEPRPRDVAVKLSAIERRILELYVGADDRGKLEMLSAIEEIAKGVEDERRRQAELESRRAAGSDSKVHQLTPPDTPSLARRNS